MFTSTEINLQCHSNRYYKYLDGSLLIQCGIHLAVHVYVCNMFTCYKPVQWMRLIE